jgi:hypothetical protein
MTVAEAPLNCFAVSSLTRIGNQSAATIEELLQGLKHCSATMWAVSTLVAERS